MVTGTTVGTGFNPAELLGGPGTWEQESVGENVGEVGKCISGGVEGTV